MADRLEFSQENGHMFCCKDCDNYEFMLTTMKGDPHYLIIVCRRCGKQRTAVLKYQFEEV
jgi:transcription elongation factor Elf1